jgi:hypothetical protein
MRLLQLAAQTGWIAPASGNREETILEVTRQPGAVVQVLDRLSCAFSRPWILNGRRTGDQAGIRRAGFGTTSRCR